MAMYASMYKLIHCSFSLNSILLVTSYMALVILLTYVVTLKVIYYVT